MDSGNFNMPGGFTHIYNKDEVVIPPEKAGKKVVINVILSLLVAAVGYYVMLPAFNLKDIKLYFWLGLVAISYPVFSFFTSKALMGTAVLPLETEIALLYRHGFIEKIL